MTNMEKAFHENINGSKYVVLFLLIASLVFGCFLLPSNALSQNEQLLSSEGFETWDSSNILIQGFEMDQNLSNGFIAQYGFVSDYNTRQSIIYKGIIPASGPYEPQDSQKLSGEEYQKALELFKSHISISQTDKFAGAKSLMVELSSDIIQITFGTGYSPEEYVTDNLGFRFAIKFDSSISKSGIQNNSLNIGAGVSCDGTNGLSLQLAYKSKFGFLDSGLGAGGIPIIGPSPKISNQEGWHAVEVIGNQSNRQYRVNIDNESRTGLVDPQVGYKRVYSVTFKLGETVLTQVSSLPVHMDKMRIYLDSIEVFKTSDKNVLNINSQGDSTLSPKPSPTIPEFPTILLLPLIGVLTAIIIIKKIQANRGLNPGVKYAKS
jgi:hypothetical protein